MEHVKRPLEEADVHANGESYNKKKIRRLKRQSPDELTILRYKKMIEDAAKKSDGVAAIDAFSRLKQEVSLVNPYLHRVVINVCANDTNAAGLYEAAFRVFEDLLARTDDESSRHSHLDESVYSALIKISAKARSYDKCLELLHRMKAENVEPRLRTYSTLLAAYCDDGNLAQAMWVKSELEHHRLELSELDFVALFRVCTLSQSKFHFDAIISEYRESISSVGPDAENALKEWFESNGARVDGKSWKCFRETIDERGRSSVTGETLTSIELVDDEVVALLNKVESLVTTDENRIQQWSEFKGWLEEHGPFDVVLDAANIGYFNQNYVGGGFSYKQIDLMVQHYEQDKKKVLVILHKRRTYEDIVPAEFHALLQSWKDRNMMYNCRSGNNDDWYWLYAAVKFQGRTLLVTNDEMRDHHFQMIHTRSLARWKERHQVYYSIHSEKYVTVTEPRAYSTRPQCLGSSWHFPVSSSSDEWLGFQLATVE